jgi:epoxide hydrolase-like predicted phosphatase
MSLRAIYFDVGGVLLRTEYQAPREHLAERLNTTYEDLVHIVFESETSARASIGDITTEAHWEAVAQRLRLPASEIKGVREEFFAGDVLDRSLVEFIRTLRPRYKTGVISNAWPDAHEFLLANKLDEVFDTIVISAEVGVMKPDPQIYQIALDKLGVPAGEAVFVDDTPPNVEAARAHGMRGILFRDPARALSELKEMMR